MSRTARKPAYVRHQASGQARVRIAGRDHYLGLIDSPESLARYTALTEEWSLSKSVDRSTLTIDDLCIRFIAHAKTYYKKGGQQTSEVSCIRLALRPVVKLYGATLASEFGPLKLEAVLQEMIAAGVVRTSINRHVGRIKKAFKWAASKQLISVVVYQALTTVSGISEGRTDAAESDPVRPVPLECVEAIREHVSRHVWAMIQTQLLTAARPGEICIMRGIDIDRSCDVWTYVPGQHKTQHHKKKRVVMLGPLAQAVLKCFLRADPSEYLFQPVDAARERSARLRTKRTTPMTPSQLAPRPKPDGKRRPRERFSVASYRRAIARGCELAFGMPTELRKIPADLPECERDRLSKLAAEWREVSCWHPHQLRHLAATELRKEHGLEAAGVVLGHSDLRTTEIYAERNLQLARDIARKVG